MSGRETTDQTKDLLARARKLARRNYTRSAICQTLSINKDQLLYLIKKYGLVVPNTLDNGSGRVPDSYHLHLAKRILADECAAARREIESGTSPRFRSGDTGRGAPGNRRQM